MGATLEISSLEEMCDLMCDNKMPKEKERWYVFTFCHGRKNGGHYVKFFGTYGGARQQMIDKYGTDWAFQYTLDDWERWRSDPERGWMMETELEVTE